MKLNLVSRPWIVVLGIILIFALVACERPLQEEEGNPPSEVPGTEVETTVPEQPTIPPAGGEGETVAPEAGGEGTEGDSSVSGDVSQQVTYTVKAGDTLVTVSQQYNVTVEALASANGLSPSDLLAVGSVLVIPGVTAPPPDTTEPTQPDPVPAEPTQPAQPQGEQVHIVQAGENLFRIGLRYGVPYQELAAYNGIANPNIISVGQAIRIPPTQ